MRIALDGPVASGKTVVGRQVAEQLGFRYLDTGAMYRAIAWLALERGAALDDETGLGRLAETAGLAIERPTQSDGREYTVLVDGRDVTWDIRSPQVEAVVSRVAAHSAVRRALVDQQRRIAAAGSIVMVGRDIGTVVLPDAEVKIFLTAAARERARRRVRQVRDRGQTADEAAVEAEIVRRDELDSTREDSPLRPATDADIVDTTDLSIAAVTDSILRLVEASA